MDREMIKCAEQQLPGHGMEARDDDGDAVDSSTSVWSTPPSSPIHSEGQSSHQAIECQGLKKPNRSKGRQVQDPKKQKPPKAEKSKVQFIPSIRVLELKSQVRDLQQQVREAITEKKQLESLLHRHTVELQYYQESEDGISQILQKHSNEARALKELLRDTRGSRDSLARQLRATENKLLNTQSSLQHLLLLSQDHSLLDREELTHKLAKAVAELEEKDKTIADMKKNLELCQASFDRQVLTEERKTKEARRMGHCLQEEINHLTKKIQDRERDLEKYNIYSQRFLKVYNKRGRENKMVQTDGLVHLLVVADNLSETQYEKAEGEEQSSPESLCSDNPVLEAEVIKNQEEEVSGNILQHQRDLLPLSSVPDPTVSPQEENTETYTDTRKESSSEGAAENQSDADCDQPKKLLEDRKC